MDGSGIWRNYKIYTVKEASPAAEANWGLRRRKKDQAGASNRSGEPQRIVSAE